MKWKTFKEEEPAFGLPIFLYKETEGIGKWFKDDDDIRRCKYWKKTEDKNGFQYYFSWWNSNGDYKRFSESEADKLKWMEIPKPI